MSFLKRFVPALYGVNFSVRLDDLSSWLKIKTKGSLKRTLKQSYREGRDYVTKPFGLRQGQGLKEDVFLSGDCLRRLAMSSKAPNSEQVPTYFSLIEQMHSQFIMEV